MISAQDYCNHGLIKDSPPNKFIPLSPSNWLGLPLSASLFFALAVPFYRFRPVSTDIDTPIAPIRNRCSIANPGLQWIITGRTKLC
jgi:hypothetical protein